MKKGGGEIASDADELRWLLALNCVPDVGPVTARALIAYCGSAQAIFKEKINHLTKIPGIGERTAARIKEFKDFKPADDELNFALKHSIDILPFYKPLYPQRLTQINDAPLFLFAKGKMNLNADRVLAIVGTRKMTEYGRHFTETLMEGLAEKDVLIISGLAYGVDIAAHKAALKNNLPTVAVLAHGLDRIYPALHKPTAVKMLEHGGLLTEYPSGTNPDRENFPTRNRIVAGMCDALLVIETAESGGAMITADLAFGYNREVFAVPGRCNDTWSAGCNKLIKTMKAGMIENASDLLAAMNWDLPDKKSKPRQASIPIGMTAAEDSLYKILQQNGKTAMDNLCTLSGLSQSEAAMTLLDMEFKGWIKTLPGKQFQLIN